MLSGSYGECGIVNEILFYTDNVSVEGIPELEVLQRKIWLGGDWLVGVVRMPSKKCTNWKLVI